jgi:hypothetical protein
MLAEGFPWTIHAITVPATFLAGLVAGWYLRERKAAEERARRELTEQRDKGGPSA